MTDSPNAMDRSTGGNQFIDADSDISDLVLEIRRGLKAIEDWGQMDGREIDLSAVTILTKPISGKICVEVSADLKGAS